MVLNTMICIIILRRNIYHIFNTLIKRTQEGEPRINTYYIPLTRRAIIILNSNSKILQYYMHLYLHFRLFVNSSIVNVPDMFI